MSNDPFKKSFKTHYKELHVQTNTDNQTQFFL